MKYLALLIGLLSLTVASQAAPGDLRAMIRDASNTVQNRDATNPDITRRSFIFFNPNYPGFPLQPRLDFADGENGAIYIDATTRRVEIKDAYLDQFIADNVQDPSSFLGQTLLGFSDTAPVKDYIDDAISGIELTPGPQGDTGPQGPTGATGATGAPGTNGTKGADGADGDDGLSAYEVAVANGFVGTEPQWLASLESTVPGPQGPAGADSTVPGPTGPTGNTGAAGAAATISVGTVTTGSAGSSATVTNVGTSNAATFNFSIPQGAKGDTGATGAPGSNASITLTTTGTSGSATYNSGTGVLNVPNYTYTPPTRSFNNTPGRSLVTSTSGGGFQVDAARDSIVTYSVTITSASTLTGGAAGYVVLEIASTNSATAGDWREISRSANGQANALIVGLALSQVGGGPVNGVVPAGWYARIRTVNTTGTPTYTYNSGQEVKL